MAKPELTSYASKEQAADNLVAHGLSVSDSKYGRKPSPEGQFLVYHNAEHTQDVISAVTKMGRLGIDGGKIDFPTVDLLRIAAAFHDVEQLEQGEGNNEKESAESAVYAMRTTGMFSTEDHQRVRGFILSTRVYPVDGTIEQRSTHDYPTQIMCDADLALLGAEDQMYWQRSMDLLREIKRNDQITPEDVRKFLNSQIALLEHHKFFTSEAAEFFPRQGEHLQQTKVLLENPVEFYKFFAKTI